MKIGNKFEINFFIMIKQSCHNIMNWYNDNNNNNKK